MWLSGCVLLACAFLTWADDGVAEQLIAGAHAERLREASVLVEAERYKDAVSVLKTLEAQNTQDEVRMGVLTGRIYLAIDRAAKAIRFFEDALALDPDSFEAAMGMGQAHVQLGQFTEARPFLIRAKVCRPESTEPDLAVALIALRTGNQGKANGQMLDLLKQDPQSEDAAIAYSKYLVLAGDSAGATQTLETFAERRPNAAAVREQLGALAFKIGREAEALQHKRVAAALYEQQGNAYRRDVVLAWLDGHKPSGTSTMPPEAQTPVTQSRAAMATMPVAVDGDFAPPVKRFPFPAGAMITGGSGFIVDDGRKIITNRHVVDGGKAFAVRTGLGEIITARVVYLSSTDDIAVLELDKPLPADRAIPAKAYGKPGVGRSVVVMGYPLWSVLGEGLPSLTNGMVAKRTGLLDDKGSFQMTARVHKGNSGGPVFDLSGQVVGITVGKLDTKRLQDEDSKVLEDVNFAIHVDRIPAIANIQLTDSVTPAPALSAEALYQAMVGKVVMVATYK